jgi:hypothetical protein
METPTAGNLSLDDGMTESASASPALQAALRGASKKGRFLTGKPRPVGGELHFG